MKPGFHPIRFLSLLIGVALATPVAAQSTERVSVATGGGEANGANEPSPSTSGDGRFVAFSSEANNLVPGDLNGTWDVFVHDRQTGITTLVSKDTSGTQGTGSSNRPVLSTDGRYVVFDSVADNLVGVDLNSSRDIFLHDLQTGVTELVSRSSNNAQGNADSLRPDISDDGRVICFESLASNLVANDGNQVTDVFAHDRQLGRTVRASVSSTGVEGNLDSTQAVVSGDGKFVAFSSGAWTLVPGDSNLLTDIFTRDLVQRTTERVSIGPFGAEANNASYLPAISRNGDIVVFESGAHNLVSGDTNSASDVFLRDRSSGATVRLSVSSSGAQASSHSHGPSISADGDVISFHSYAGDLVPGDVNGWWDVFSHRRSSGATELLSLGPGSVQGNWNAWASRISGDATTVVYHSDSNNLVPNDLNGVPDAFVRDGLGGGGTLANTTRVSEGTGGIEGNGQSGTSALTADGRYVVFYSDSDNLVPNDANGKTDVFFHDRATGATELISVSSAGVQGNDISYLQDLSDDGRYVVFTSYASNLIPSDLNPSADVFLRDRATGVTELISKSSLGVQANGLTYAAKVSADGRYIAFESAASNLVPNDTNGARDVFVHDRAMGTTIRASVDSNSSEGNDDSYFHTGGAISADGRFVVFNSDATNLVPGDGNAMKDVFLHDLELGTTERISVSSTGGDANAASWQCDISADGRWVVFQSLATDIAAGGTPLGSIYVRDRDAQTTALVSKSSQGVPAVDHSSYPAISPSGDSVCFSSLDANLVPGGSNGTLNVYLHQRSAGLTELISQDSSGAVGNLFSLEAALSADERFVSFTSFADNLVPGDANGVADVFVRDRGSAAGATNGTIVLGADVIVNAHSRLRCSWFAAPPGSNWYLLASKRNLGTTIGGHAFGVGPTYRILVNGVHGATGSASVLTPPLPSNFVGVTIYLEVAARLGNKVYDSNTVERTVR